MIMPIQLSSALRSNFVVELVEMNTLSRKKVSFYVRKLNVPSDVV